MAISSALKVISSTTRINIQDAENLLYWCKKLNCTKELLTYCVMMVGSNSNAVADYLYMNQDRFDRYFAQIWNDFKMN